MTTKRLMEAFLDTLEEIKQLRFERDKANDALKSVEKERDELRLGVEKLQAELRPPRPDLSEVMPMTPRSTIIRQGVNGSTFGA